MNQSSKQILLKILEITGYKGDKEKFTNDFLSLCIQKTLPDLIDSMPYEKQVELSQRINFMTPEKQEIIILEYINQEVFDKAHLAVTIKTLQDYMNSIQSTLTEDQKFKLEAFLSTLTANPASSF